NDEIIRVNFTSGEACADLAEGSVVGGGEALVLVEKDGVNSLPAEGPFEDDLAGAVGRSVVDDDDLVDEVREVFENANNGRLFVEDGDDGDASRHGLLRERFRPPFKDRHRG